MRHINKSPLAISGSVFAVGMAALVLTLVPFFNNGKHGGSLLIGALISMVASVVYMIGTRTVCATYSRRWLTVTFGPFILSLFIAGVLAYTWVVFVLAHWNIL